MTHVPALCSLPVGGLSHRLAGWSLGLWRLLAMFALALALGACGGGGGGGGGGTDIGGGGGTTPPPVTGTPPTGAPAIVAQPANVAVTAGQAATFSVAVTGTAPLTYEWLRNGVVIAGSNAASYTLTPTALSDNGAQFSVSVSNGAGRITSTPATLSVSAAVMAPSFTSQPANATALVGQTARFVAAATGSDPLTYQWLRNGVAVAGATSADYTTPALVLADNGAVYTVTVSNSAGTATSSGALLNVNALPTAPAITTQPAGQTVTLGQSATFRVVVTGDPAPTFQWRRNGVDIAGATGDAYTTPSTRLEDSGVVFSVAVRNTAGSVLSSDAILTVTGSAVAPSITTQPLAQSVITGRSASFSVAATGTSPLAYQWRRNGVDIAGANAATYTTPTLTEANSGSLYTVAVSNGVGSIVSAPALLTVNPIPVAPAITAEPTNQSVTAGARATFSVTVTGTGPLQFQWSRNGNPLAGASSAAYTTPPTTLGDSGAVFRVVVSNSAGSVTSANVSLTVNAAATAPTITTQPSPQAVTVGQAASFSVAAAGTEPFSYQWKRNGVDIAGATAASYRLGTTVLEDSGALFTVVVTNAGGSVTSNPARLAVSPLPVAPTITTQPAAQTVIAGQVASFTVRATGSTPLAYQWRRNGDNIAGATSQTYSTPVSTGADNGAIYDVVVTNSVGSITSSPANLTVLAPLASSYWLRGSAGVGTAGSVTFANGSVTANNLNLTLVDPANLGSPLVVEQPGGWLLQAVASEPRFNPQNAGDSAERYVVYARANQLWRLDLGLVTGLPAPQQVSNVNLNSLCSPVGGAGGITGFFADNADAGNSLLQYRTPGGDGICQTTDDGYVAFRVSATATTAPVNTQRILLALRNSGGSIIGFLARSGNQIQRLNANLGGATNAFTVGSSEIELLRQPGGPGILVFRDGNALRAYDTATGAEPVTFGTAAPDFLQLGEIAGSPSVSLYRNNGRVVAFPLSISGTLSTVLTLAPGQSVSGAGGDANQQLLVLASGSSSQLISVGTSGPVTVLVEESGLIDAASLGATPTRWVYTVQGGRTLRSVLRTGGVPLTLASSDSLRVFNIGSWNYETVWYELRGAGGGFFGSQVRASNSDGGSLVSLSNAVTVGGASFNGFQDTSVGRIVATPVGANPTTPYQGVTLLVLDPVTGSTRVTYGALAGAGYNTIDVSGLSGPNRPVLITASSVQVLGATTADLYFVRVGSTGLLRLTNFVP